MTHLTISKEKKLENIEEMKSPDVNNLVVDIMRKKLEEKFGSHLSGQQLSLLREYVFSGESKEAFISRLAEIKNQTLASIDQFEETCDNDVILSQISKVRESVNSLSTSSADDETLSRYMTLMKITEELKSGDDNG